MNVLQQIHAYHRQKRPQFTPREVSIFLNGMTYAGRIAKGTSRGYIAAEAINKELRTLKMFAEQKKVI